MARKNMKKRKWKGSLRKTIGALLMATAIVIAAIPVENLGAAETTREMKVTVDPENCKIPLVDKREKIYTTGDGSFQFAYVAGKDAASTNRFAVILGYNGGYLQGGTLTIPDKIDAYLKFTDNVGGGLGYCAVAKNGSFLYYEEQQIVEESEIASPDRMEYKPCYYEDRAKWENIPVDKLYYKANDGTYRITDTADYQPIRQAQVRYIGNQYLIAGEGEDAGTWTVGGIITEPGQGIFYGEKAGNIVHLNVGSELAGVGNYAFYECSNLQSITLGNALDTIGNYAFANCINMKSVNADLNAMINIIGDHAFYNCAGLESFVMPISVKAVGDSAFEECRSLKTIDLCGNGNNVALATLGYDLFKNCTSLQGVEFPRSLKEELEIGMFEGCRSLQTIKQNNESLRFIEGASGFTFEDFRNTVPKTFFFEGIKDSDLHQTASRYCIAFKYHNEDVYEITVEDEAGNRALFQVNAAGELIRCEIPEGMERVNLPEQIGPGKIEFLGETSFRNNCFLKYIVIPSSVKKIASGAFMGCHNLKMVQFTEPVNITEIGEKAFQTQNITSEEHKKNCPSKKLEKKPSLYFVGPISGQCVPFSYAVNSQNKLNVSGQERAYITYSTGWPKNMEAEYDPETDKVTLCNYPTFRQITDYTLDSYPYMTAEYVKAASSAVSKYIAQEKLTDGEKEIINSALAIEVPKEIVSIRKNLIRDNEGEETYAVEKTFTAYGIEALEEGTFADCQNFVGIYLKDTTVSVGDGAFRNCSNLQEVALSDTVQTLGSLPFYGCTKLSFVNFMNSKYFVCPSSESAIIYQLDEEGRRTKIVEMLPGRNNRRLTASEFENVEEMAPGAFMGTNVGNVDLRESQIAVIPEEAFAETPNLDTIYFPRKWSRVDEDAFRDSGVQYLEIYGEYGNIDNHAFSGSTNSDGNMTFYCEKGSSAESYAKQNKIRIVNIPTERFYKVTFYDYDMSVISVQNVRAGEDAILPRDPVREGYVFVGWSFSHQNITKDTDIKAEYKEDSEYGTVVVTFYTHDGKPIGTPMRIPKGTGITNPPEAPARQNYRFTGWSEDITNVTTDINPHALYEYMDGRFTVRFLDSDETTVLYSIPVEPGKDCVLPIPPTKAGKRFVKWTPSPVKVMSDMDCYAVYEDGTGDEPDVPAKTYYTLTVKNGLGTGSYLAGSNVVIKAQEPGTNQEFVSWTSDPADLTMTDKNVSAAIVTMPAANVTVTANFKSKSGGSDPTPTPTPKPGTPGTPGTPGGGGTTVVIDKNGLSNTGVVSAVVNGSSDNFVIRVCEDADASEAVMKALQGEYGSSLSNIKYFPMDISLYDSTGTNKITDTSGLSITITLPIPDSLVQYAGNNKVMSVKNGKMERLDVKYTTISGVPCVTFRAEHFSPYAIFVNLGNVLEGGGGYDETPKTGDGIHPKWFLSLGLACAAVFLFLKKDRRYVKA